MDIAKLVVEMIHDYERIRGMVEIRLRELREMANQLGVETRLQPEAATGGGQQMVGDIRSEIERRRNEIMAQTERIKAQALSQMGGGFGGAVPCGVPTLGIGAPNAFAGNLSTSGGNRR